MLIYQATSPSNKSYIGLTRETLKDRQERHKKSVLMGSKYAFHCAIRKYGWNNIRWKILKQNIINWKKLIERERLFRLAII